VASRPWICAVLLVIAACAFADAVDDQLGVARKAFAAGDYTLAARGFQRIVAEHPESARADEAGYLLGVSLFYDGKWTDALEAFADQGTRHPRSALLPRAAYWSAAAHLKLGRAEQCLALLASSARFPDGDSFRGPALLLKATAQETLGREAEAAEGYRSILADRSMAALAPEATYRLAGTEYRAARWEAARGLYGRVLVDFAQSGFARDSLFFLAECELALGNLPDAEKRYATLLSLYPDSSYREASLFRLADAAWRRKDPSAALDRLDDLQKQYPNGAYGGSALRLRADMLFDQNRYDQALSEE